MRDNPFAVTPRKPLTTLQRAKLFAQHGGVCCLCGVPIKAVESWIDEHMIPLSQGGGNELENRRPVHVKCARAKTREDARTLSNERQEYARKVNAKVSKRPMMGSIASGWKRKMDGTWVRRDD